MKRVLWLVLLCCAAPVAARAQAPADPVSSELRSVLDSYATNLVATAEEFPVDKYTYHPTPEEMTVGATMAHIAQVNNFACAKVAGTPGPRADRAEETDKDKLVAGLKASMDYCRQAFAGLTDAKLGDAVTLFGTRNTTRFAAAIEVTNDLIDHYAALAVYLRLNGLLPPTARRGR
jgi:uncharacterized damage-inducible protein DinB